MKQVRTWDEFFENIAETMYFQNIQTFLSSAYQKKVYPKRDDVFKAFTLTPLEKVKVVIIGQDPYHQPGQAMGLAFSVPSKEKLPPSLRNIFKEMSDDLKVPLREDGDLIYLAKQGVFLYNTILTVKEGKPLSHNISAYESFTSEVLKTLNNAPQPMVFLLWGTKAKEYRKYINATNKLVLTANHPSPLSANRGGFFGTKHFSKTNEFLAKYGINPINWV